MFGVQNKASGTYSLAGGNSNTANGIASSVLGGFKNTVSANSSTLAGGCSNLVGKGTVTVNALCSDTPGHAGDFASGAGGTGNHGGEGVTGGATIAATGTDGTYGLISDTLNQPASGGHTLTLDVAPGACGSGALSVAGAQVGDVPAIEYGAAPPAGLIIQLTGITSAGHVDLQWCNDTAATIHYDNEPFRIMTLR